MKKILVAIAIIVVLLMAGIFAIKYFTGNSIKEDDVKEFQVKAFRFGYSPGIINNTDTFHGIRIPYLGIKGNEILEFTADKEGEFSWYCNNMCGSGHMQMQGKLIVR